MRHGTWTFSTSLLRPGHDVQVLQVDTTDKTTMTVSSSIRHLARHLTTAHRYQHSDILQPLALSLDLLTFLYILSKTQNCYWPSRSPPNTLPTRSTNSSSTLAGPNSTTFTTIGNRQNAELDNPLILRHCETAGSSYLSSTS